MRRIGRLDTEALANRFRDYLLTQGIDSRIDPDDGAFAVWILDEDRLAAAREELQTFEQQPNGEKYVRAVNEAKQRRQQKLDEELAARKRQIDLKKEWEAPASRRYPITFLLILLSGAFSFATRFGENRETFARLAISQVRYDARLPGHFPLPEVRQGEVWRLVTPIFLHMGIMHLLMNMYWLHFLGNLTEHLRGRWRYLAMVLVLAVFSNLVQYFWSGPNFGGMSGVISGLFGFVWFKTTFAPEEGYDLPQSTSLFFFLFLLLCATTDLFGPIANGAHLGGLFAGVALAWGNSLLRGR